MPRLAFAPFLLFWFAAALVGQDAATNWSRFRGPNGTGLSDAKGVPVKWDDKEGLLWKIPIPGKGNSSPVVWGRRIFLQTAADAGNDRSLLCIDGDTGKLRWSRSIPGSTRKIHQRNTLATSTPATDGERVYALFWDAEKLILCAYDFDGKLLWKNDLGSFTGQHGVGASPIVVGGKVILANDQDKSSQLLAFDARSGRKAWEASRPGFDACYSTPFLLEKPGAAPALIVASTAGISAYDPAAGSVLWNWVWDFHGKPLRTVASPIFGGGLVFITSGNGGGARNIVAVRIPNGADVSEAKLAWETRRTLPYVPTMLFWQEHIYWVNDLGVAGCQSAQTGESVWMNRLGGNMAASPILVDGKIYAASEEGDVYVFPASPSFESPAVSSVGELVRATPAVMGDRLLIRGSTHLFCIGR